MIRLHWLFVPVVLAGCGDVPVGESRTDHHTIERDKAELTRLDLEMTAGDLVVAGGATPFLEAEFTYNVDRWRPVIERLSSGGRSVVKVSQPEAGGLTLGNATSRWDLRLNDSSPVEVVANVGAGEADMKLGSLDLRGVEVALGAGEVHVDLRGNPTHSYKVRISGGVGEAEVYLPANVGISASASGGLGSIDVEGLERSGERWINPGHERDAVQLDVDVSGGIGEIRLIAR